MFDLLSRRAVYIFIFYLSLSTLAFSAVLTRVRVDPQLISFIQKIRKKTVSRSN